MDSLAQYFDHYVISARLKPAFFVVLPAAITTIVWLPQAQQLGGAILTFMATFGVIGFFSNLVSNCGNELQTRLFTEWGGAPTTALLRFADDNLDQYTKQRYHRRLEAMVPGLEMPSHEREQVDQAKADACYASATNFLREYTRDRKRYPLVYLDNVAYGYARNLLAMKPFGILGSVFCLLANVTLLYLDLSGQLTLDFSRSNQMQLVFGAGALVVSLIMLWIFSGVVNREYVKGRAVRYAKSLLATCEAGP